jgi:hypothetical protein
MDTSLMQTLGLTSLVLLLVGYYAGRCASCATRQASCRSPSVAAATS